MAHSCCSGTFSSRSLGGCLRSPGSCWGSSYPSNLVHSPDLGSPSPCRRGSSLYRGQETCWEPPSCQTSCCGPRTPRLCGPCWTPPGALGCGSGGFQSVGWGINALSSLSCGPSFSRPTSCSSGSCPSFLANQPGGLAPTNSRFEHSAYCI